MKYAAAGRRPTQHFDSDVMPFHSSRSGGAAQLVPGGTEEVDVAGADITLGMARKELFLAFQPQFSIDGSDPNLSGVEALIRWNHPDLGLLLPGQFLPEVEAAGLECELGAYVLRAAVDQIQAWLSTAGWSPRVAINMAAKQLDSPTLCRDVLGVLDASGVATHYLEIEILESAVIRNSERTAHELRALNDAGVAVAVDDFGTGFASLQYLLQFPFDTLKICSSFVHGIGHGIGADEICQAVIQLGRSLGKRVIAEGVETSQQLDFLRSHLCEEVQGFLLARPMAGDAFTNSFMKQRESTRRPWH